MYGMVYGDAAGEKDADGNVIKKVNDMTLAEKMASKALGIADVKDGLYGQSFWLPFKQLLRATDAGAYGTNVRLNNNVVMRYAEVLLLYAEACLQSGDTAEGAKYVNMIRERVGLAPLASVGMPELKKEKSYELWLEGSRWLDLLRWGDTDRVKQAGQAVPKLFDKLYRTPQATDVNVKWENGTEANSRFYTVDTHEAIVDKETWELAQRLRKTPKRIDTLGEANPLTGLLYCADCGEKMYNHRSRGGTENNPYPSDFFDCSAYTLAHQKRTSACFGHYISTKALRTLILDTIRTVSTT